jgi:hypothetical protein
MGQRDQLITAKSDIRRLRADVSMRPIITKACRSIETWLLILGGNTLTSGQPGIKHSSDTEDDLTAVPDAYADTTLPDYVGRAWIFRNGVQGIIPDGIGGMKPERVLVVSDQRAMYPNALIAGDWCRAYLQVKLGEVPAAPPDPAIPFYAYSPTYL